MKALIILLFVGSCWGIQSDPKPRRTTTNHEGRYFMPKGYFEISNNQVDAEGWYFDTEPELITERINLTGDSIVLIHNEDYKMVLLKCRFIGSKIISDRYYIIYDAGAKEFYNIQTIAVK